MGLLKTAAKVAVASHVHGNVKRRQHRRWAAEDAQASPAQAPPVPTVVAPRAKPDVILAQLTELGQLRAAGVLNDAEFEVQKARILSQ